MLDIKFILENKELVESKLLSMGEKIDFALIENLSKDRKNLIQRIEEINSILHSLTIMKYCVIIPCNIFILKANGPI